MTEFTPFDYWLMARVEAGYKRGDENGKPTPRAANIIEIMEQFAPKDRYYTLKSKLTPDDLRLVSIVDTEMPEPREIKPAAPDGTRAVASGASWYIIPAGELPNIPPVTWLIPGELPERSITMIFGASGASKSFLALDYALQVAQQSPVVYGAFEGETGYPARVAAWCKHNRKGVGKLFMCLGFVEMIQDMQLNAFIASCQQIKPRLVVIDTLAMSMIGSDENNTRDMGLYIKTCKRLIAELDCSVLLLHHTNKAGIQERGSGAMRGSCDMMIRVSLSDDIIFKECSKSKDSRPFETQSYKLLPVTVSLAGRAEDSAVLIPYKLVMQSAGDDLTANQRKILETLRLAVFVLDGAAMSDLVESTGIGRGSLYKTTSRMIELGFIEKRGKRDGLFFITNTGIKKLSPDDSLVDSINDSRSRPNLNPPRMIPLTPSNVQNSGSSSDASPESRSHWSQSNLNDSLSTPQLPGFESRKPSALDL